MVHSLQDRAYALQLEGDILWAFEDAAAACEKYLQSAFLYRNVKRWLDAASLYEHIHILDSENLDTLIQAVPCYAQLGWDKKFNYNLDRIFAAISKNAWDDKFIINIIRALAESAKEIENEKLKSELGHKLAQVVSTLPKNIAEKLEPILKKSF